MAHAHTTRTIASLGLVLAAFVAPATAGHARTYDAPAAKSAPVVVEVAAPAPVIYALPDDEDVYNNTIAAFEDAGFTAPDFLARFHTSDEACKGYFGLHVVTADGTSTIHVCRTHDNPVLVGMVRERTLMHEIAHAWVEQNVSHEQQAAFMELRGLSVWDGEGAAWAELGAEHAAEILLWGMTGESRTINWQIEQSDVDNLWEAYRILVDGMTS